MVVLCTSQGVHKESSLDTVTWRLPDVLTPQDNQNYAAIVSVQSMSFVNMYHNIHNTHGRNNTVMKIMSTYTANNIVQTPDKITINLDPGNYSITALLDTLNAKAGAFNTYYQGLGDARNISTNPAFQLAAHDKGKITYAPPPTGPDGLGNRVSAHTYTGFYLIVDEDTTPLLKTLGFLRSEREDGSLLDLKYVEGYNVLGFNVNAVQVGDPYTYPENNSHSLNAFNLGSQSMLLQWEGNQLESRASADDLRRGSTLAVVPTLSGYGFAQSYEPKNPFRAVLSNFNPFEFKLTVVGVEDGLPWDFYGIPWTVALTVEYIEIDTEQYSSGAANGDYITRHPNLHNTLVDYNLPYSGKRPRLDM